MRFTRRIKRYIRYLIIAIVAVIIARYGKDVNLSGSKDSEPVTTTSTARNVDTQAIELPVISSQSHLVLLQRTNYTVLFNTETNLPVWVAWEMTKDETSGSAKREEQFLVDPDISASAAVTPNDYSRSGYDRGHMCPAADNRYDRQAMKESFYMTNICPQNHELNEGKWNDLEIACRRWAKRYGRIYIACGPVTDDLSLQHAIGKDHQVAVPTAFFKVILLTDTNPPRAIGYLFKNDGSASPVSAYSVDDMEALTGLDFFTALPDETEDTIEATFNEDLWSW